MSELIVDRGPLLVSSYTPKAKTSFGVRLADADGFKPGELLKLQRSINLWAEVWNSDEFAREVQTFRWSKVVTTGKWPFRNTVRYGDNRFRWNDLPKHQDLTNSEVLEALLSGSELDTPEADGEADIFVTIDRDLGRGVKGYTYKGKPRQWIGGWFFSSGDEADIAGNLAHEYCHRRGFSHEFKKTALREFTVPYAIGYITARLAEEFLDRRRSQLAS